MEQKTQQNLNEIFQRDTWSTEDFQELRSVLQSMSDPTQKLRAAVGDLAAENPEAKGAAALKLGMACYVLCQFSRALKFLSSATDNKDRRYFQGLCHKQLRNWKEAITAFGQAKDQGYDSDECTLQTIEVQVLGGDVEKARKDLAKRENKYDGLSRYWYLMGLVEELGGDGEAGAEHYHKALEIDPNSAEANFRLAYYYDLHGEDEEAMALYEECISSPPVHANALLNLAVMLEDRGEYDQAAYYLRKILQTNPNHARARLFLRDVEASTTMYYDEDQARRIARRNAVLDIPVTDFELSVRARNCLKKMNINTLGDLVRTTEAELLGYKNFGETSLKEIKEMLAAKGLRLGQALEEGSDFGLDAPASSAAASVANEGVLATPVSQVDFSIRARKALESLNVQTLGDLTGKTEAEFLACRNFGQTSLNEIKQRLTEYGLRLREP